MNKPNKKERQRQSIEKAQQHETALREAASLVESAGMLLKWSHCQSGPTTFLHVMLNDLDGSRLLNWYPSSGKWKSPKDRTAGECDDIDTAVWIADQKRSGVLSDIS